MMQTVPPPLFFLLAGFLSVLLFLWGVFMGTPAGSSWDAGSFWDSKNGQHKTLARTHTHTPRVVSALPPRLISPTRLRFARAR